MMTAVSAAPVASASPVSAKDEYSGPDGPDGMTVVTTDPTMEAAAASAPTAPPVTAAQRGKVLPGIPNTGAVGFDVPAVPAVPAVPEMPEAPQETAAPATGGPLRLVFTGVSGSGKSTLAKQLGLQEIQIQDSIHDLYQRYFPGAEPPVDFVNTLLVWGEGVVDPKTPVTPARMLFIDFIRSMLVPRGYNFLFGQRGFWQKLLIAQANRIEGPAVVTTCTTKELLAELVSQGFAHFHVACSNQTMATRKRRQGANDSLANSFTQGILREISLRPQGATLPLVWFDTVPAPSPRFLTLETARQVLLASQQSTITGE